MQHVLLSKLASLAFFALSTTLLLSAICSIHWVSRFTLLGPANEGLWTTCTRFGCVSLERGLVYNIFTDGFLCLAAAVGASCTTVYIIHLVFKRTTWWIRNTTRSALLSAVLTIVAMSVYTGKFTSDVPTANRGWSFYVAWGSIISFLGAAATSFHVLLQIAAEERA